MRLRTGRKVGRTIYVQLGLQPSDDDVLIGMMDTVEYAELICRAVNVETKAEFEKSRETQRDSEPLGVPRTVEATQSTRQTLSVDHSRQETINRNVRRAWDAEFNGIDPREHTMPYDE